MKLVTAAQMRGIDRCAIDKLGVPGLVLMENAGRGIADLISDILHSDPKGKHVAIFCGAGNNGGDGFVIARYLHERDTKVTVFLIAPRDLTKGDALVNLEKVEQLGITTVTLASNSALPNLSDFSLIVDAIFGTGFRGEIEGDIIKIIEFINGSGLPIMAVDTPSGLNNDSGEIGGACIRANYTGTLGLPKVGQYFYPGRSYCGEIRVIDIGIPDAAIPSGELSLNLITAGEVAKRIPERSPTAHKGDCGKLFIVAGSVGMTGAAALAAESAVKSGCGLVTVGVPKSLNDILEIKLTEAMTKPLAELNQRRALPVRALGQILENIETVDAVCLGPGVGRHHETIELFRRIISKLKKPAVLDADGLFAFSGKPELLRQCEVDLVITPHIGEFSRLCGTEIAEIEKNRVESITAFSREINKIVLLKGAPTLIASPDGQVYLNPTGNSGMATGGSGDVLTGVIGALLALKMSALDAAIGGAYIHGSAGDLTRDSIGTFGMTAGDICNNLPKAFKLLKN